MTTKLINGVLVKQFFSGGRIIDLRTSRKCHKCAECGLIIEPSEQYYSITWGGSGLGSLKFPDRVQLAQEQCHFYMLSLWCANRVEPGAGE